MESTVPRWMGPESTNAPALSEEEEYEEETYARDGVQLLERFLRGRMILRPRSVFLALTICWFGIVSWLFVRDNELGRLIDPSGMRWFWSKAGIYSVFYLLAGGIIGISSLFGRRKKGEERP